MNTTSNLVAVGLLLANLGNALAVVHYVDVNCTNATPPHANWATAATNIQDAVDAAVAGDEIVVTNGIYATGGRAVSGTTNRVAVDKLLNVRSANGPQFTTIDGSSSNRCVYLTNGASLFGFTLTNGRAVSGGGLWCDSTNAVASNCVVVGNSAYISGGGAYGGTLNNCLLSENGAYSAYGFDEYGDGGGAINATLNNCTLIGNSATFGAGVFVCSLNNCTLSGNFANTGGGALGGTLNNCTLTGNSATSGGGAFGGTLNNCILTGNSGGGVIYGRLNNCIVYFNTWANYDGGTLNYSCTTPQPTNGVGNITNAPRFVDTNGWSNLRLQSNSPCINVGLNAFAPVGPDLDGNPRIVGGTVDMGAYEFQSLSLINFGVVSNQFGFNVTGQSNWVIVLEASSDLSHWTPLTTNTLGAHPFPFSDPTPPNLPRRFYRARLQ